MRGGIHHSADLFQQIPLHGFQRDFFLGVGESGVLLLVDALTTAQSSRLTSLLSSSGPLPSVRGCEPHAAPAGRAHADSYREQPGTSRSARRPAPGRRRCSFRPSQPFRNCSCVGSFLAIRTYWAALAFDIAWTKSAGGNGIDEIDRRVVRLAFVEGRGATEVLEQVRKTGQVDAAPVLNRPTRLRHPCS